MRPHAQPMKAQIRRACNSPRDLERLYRESPRAFTRELSALYEEQPESLILQAWYERLFFEDDVTSPRIRIRFIVALLVITLCGGTLLKLPVFFEGIAAELFYAKYTGVLLAMSLSVFFYVRGRYTLRTLGLCITGACAAGAFLTMIPGTMSSQPLALSCIHMIFLLWTLTGIAYLGGRWRDMQGRMNYVVYSGEMVIYGSLIGCGVSVLAAVTLSLFSLIDMYIEEWYVINVAVYGAVALPLIATLFINDKDAGGVTFAPVLARIFTPLFLVTLVAYLCAILMVGKSPFTDRDFLIAFNGVLILVLGLCVFSIIARKDDASLGISDVMNIALVCCTLILDGVALAAILFRLSSYGFTPNRIAVLGGNIVVFVHLAGCMYLYIRSLIQRGSLEKLRHWSVGYIPVYVVWCLCVSVGFPIIL